mmetsp:Transcript_10440/g.42567  ORF Transcript_10440/g.42567 Transcript_10440/m.42567 type:complete len:395 (+) Transcript_10440:9056-10240(+)
MVVGAHLQHGGAKRRPDIGGALHELRVGEGLGREDDLPPFIQRGFRMLHAAGLLARDGVAGHEAGRTITEGATRGFNDVAFGRAHVHEQHTRVHQVADGLERALGGRNRHGDQHDVRPRHGQQGRFRGDIDHAELLGPLRRGRRFAVADDALDQTGPLHRQREAAAHQAASDHAELLEHGRPWLVLDRVGTQHLEEGTEFAQLAQCCGDMGLAGVAVQVDVEVIVPLAGAGRARLEPCHRHSMRLQRHQQVMHRPRAVGHRDHEAGAVAASRRRRGHGLRQANDGKARAVVGLVLDGMRRDVQAEQRGRAFAAERRPGGVGGCEPRTLGVAGHGAALDVGQMLVQPVLALRQRLRVGQHGLNAMHGRLLAHQVVADQQADLADDMAGRVQEEVE